MHSYSLYAEEAAQSFRDLGAYVNTLAAQMLKNPDTYDTGCAELFKKIILAQHAIRRELEVEV